MHYYTPSKGVKPPSDREVDLIEKQRAATRIELLVMEIISRVMQTSACNIQC